MTATYDCPAETSVGCMACRNERGAARRNCELNACPYTKEKAVGGRWDTTTSCTKHSDCTYGWVCDNRNGHCHTGSWARNAESEVGKRNTDATALQKRTVRIKLPKRR